MAKLKVNTKFTSQMKIYNSNAVRTLTLPGAQTNARYDII